MKVKKICMCWLSWLVIIAITIPTGIMAQEYGQTEQPDMFKKEELVQMLAPIALYPDSLLAQILMASTYPIEVVEAERWLKKNKNLKGDELDRALLGKTWDASVKSLCYFPDVLYAMSEKLDQTTKLGDAFLSMQDEVMDTIQELRWKAYKEGNLKTTKEQKVVFDDQAIKIEPADSEVVYLPIYDPLYVYGPWWYPAYPPYYWYYPPGVVIAGGIIGFGFGIFISSCCWFDWHHHAIHIDIHRVRHFHRFPQDFGRHPWRHNPVHRKGVAYRDRAISQRFGQLPLHRPAVRPEFRGYAGREYGGHTIEPMRGTVGMRGISDMTVRRIERGRVVQRPSIRSNAFSGIGNWKFERRASERGFTSRQSGISRGGGGFWGSGQGGGFRR